MDSKKSDEIENQKAEENNDNETQKANRQEQITESQQATQTYEYTCKWQPTPVFLPGKFHGRRSLVGHSPWGRKELAMTEHVSTIYTQTNLKINIVDAVAY